MKSLINCAKFVVVVSFVVTLFATYFLRSEMLGLNKLRYAAEKMSAEYDERDARASYPLRVKEHEIELSNYELRMENYKKQLDLYESDYERYAELTQKGEIKAPRLPARPDKPKPPTYRDEVLKLRSDFRSKQLGYYSKSYTMNWVVCASSMLLTGGLIFLILFESGAQKFAYLAILVVSFVFMIGPSFHSILSALIGVLEEPHF